MGKVERDNTRVPQASIRLNKFLALAGVGSRRSNDELIVSGEVKVNGRIVRELGTKVHPQRDRITVRGNPVYFTEKPVYLILNKPKDCISTVKDEKGRTTVLDYVRVKERVYPVGRLDRNSTGVLLLTNDGLLANALLHPRHAIKKAYHVRLDRGLLDTDARKLTRGIILDDGEVTVDGLQVVPKSKRTELVVEVHEGRNRLVRRIFEALGYRVKKLDRLSFAGITASNLPRGKWRKLTDKEVEHLKKISGQERD